MSISGLGEIFDFGSKLIDKLFPDPAQRDEAKFKLAQLADQGELRELDAAAKSDSNQTEINKIDAGSDRFLQYGWRPFIGWICGFGLLYQFLGQPLLSWTGGIWDFPAAPKIELGDLITLLMGMLGLAGMRTIEKKKGQKNA